MLQGDSTVVGTSKLRDLYERFEEELVRRQQRAKSARPRWEPPKTKLDEDPGECWVLPGQLLSPWSVQTYSFMPLPLSPELCLNSESVCLEVAI